MNAIDAIQEQIKTHKTQLLHHALYEKSNNP